MWHALKAELAYSRRWLLGGFGIAVANAVLVSVIFGLVGDKGPPTFVATGLRGMFLIMAPLVVSFTVQSFRIEERRARLLLSGSLTPRQIAGVMALLPTVLFAIGALAATLVIAAELSVTGRLELEALHIVGYVGGLIYMMTMMGLLLQESVAAVRQRRRPAAAAGWAGFVTAVLLLVALSSLAVLRQGPMAWMSLHLGNLIVAAVTLHRQCVALRTPKRLHPITLGRALTVLSITRSDGVSRSKEGYYELGRSLGVVVDLAPVTPGSRLGRAIGCPRFDLGVAAQASRTSICPIAHSMESHFGVRI